VNPVSTRRALAVAAVFVAVLVALPRFLTHTPYQRLGAYVVHRVVERVVGPPAKGMLQPGDSLLTSADSTMAQAGIPDSLRARGWPRGPFPLTLRRGTSTLTLTIPPVQLSA
jgi:hypothetical protein